jgi:hypothetical protein
MGLDIQFSTPLESVQYRLIAADIGLLSIIRKQHPSEVNVLFGTVGPGQSVEVPAQLLDRAAATLQDVLEKDRETLPYTYMCEFSEGPFSDCGMDAMHVSGFRLPGDEQSGYGIECGLGFCNLIKASGGRVSRTDIRHLNELRTADMGVVRFSRKKVKKSRLCDILQELRSFLTRQTSTTVRKTFG